LFERSNGFDKCSPFFGDYALRAGRGFKVHKPQVNVLQPDQAQARPWARLRNADRRAIGNGGRRVAATVIGIWAAPSGDNIEGNPRTGPKTCNAGAVQNFL
jgi:hypothetical protein